MLSAFLGPLRRCFWILLGPMPSGKSDKWGLADHGPGQFSAEMADFGPKGATTTPKWHSRPMGQNPNKRTVFFTWLKRIFYIFQPWGTVHFDFIAFLGLGRRPKTRNAIKSKCTVPQGWAKHAQIVTFPKNVALIGILTQNLACVVPTSTFVLSTLQWLLVHVVALVF